MNLITVSKKFASTEACLNYLEKMRWPNGVCCLKCGITDKDDKGREVISKFTTNETTRERYSKRKKKMMTVKVPARSLYQCKECGYQFSATTGTIFHDSHLPLEKWFMAVALIMNAKKGVSALQIGRDLGIPQENYKTVWYLCHRIREAMQEGGFEFMTGVVEADETYLLPRRPRKGHPKVKNQEPHVVLGIRQRGGPLRLIPIKDAKMRTIEPELVKHISPEATLQTDKAPVYEIIGKRRFANHRMIDHIRTYVEGENHTNTVESAFSLLKRGVYGTFHKVSIKHLGRYCNEFSYRFNRRGQQEQMFSETMKGLLRGKPLQYKKLTT